MKIDSTGTRIKFRRKALGMSADEVAEALGISRATLYRYESPDESRIPTRLLASLAKVLQTSPDYILGNEEVREKWISENTIPLSQITYIPIIGTVRAGIGGIAFEEHLGEEFVETSSLKGHSPNEFFWSIVKGNSMEPRLFENDLVLVRKQTSIDSGDYAVVLVDDEEGVVKRVVYDDKSITLISQNPIYPPRVFRGKEVLRVRIVGKVIKSQSNF